MGGDTVTLYFWIKRQDLKSRFDDAWLILQCA
jgi:uncharacterized protein YwqG